MGLCMRDGEMRKLSCTETKHVGQRELVALKSGTESRLNRNGKEHPEGMFLMNMWKAYDIKYSIRTQSNNHDVIQLTSAYG